MGNYMEACLQRKETEEEKPQEQQQQQESGKPGGTFGKGSSTVRVKLVLTKDELEWLLFQLKNKEGKSLEDVLGEIEKSRVSGKSVAGWKPSLESIMETPEVHHEMERFRFV